jgi:SAM-dependent methyltransferase
VSEPLYLLGHSPAELDRLRLQSALFEDITRSAFAAAGLQPGWRVLDVGCGAGDVSFLAAEMVGATGSVVGVDRAPDAIAAARRRARAEARTNVAFRAGAIDLLDDDHGFDALVGRFVLMHQADAAGTLRAAARHVRPGGIVVMIESAFSACVAGYHSLPHSPVYDRMLGIMTRLIRAAGADPAMGLRLAGVFTAAGLPAPALRLQARVDGGSGAVIGRYLADSLRSVLPAAAGLGVEDCTGRHVDALEAALEAELAVTGGLLVSPPIVSAWSAA